LPRRFHSSAVVSTPHPCDCFSAWDARQHRDRRQRRPGPADAAATSELDALGRGASVGLCECGDRVVRRCRCAEVGPPHPSVIPFEGSGIARQEVDAKFGLEAVGQRASQSPTADSAAAGELHDVRTIRPRDHDGIVKGRCSTTADIAIRTTRRTTGQARLTCDLPPDRGRPTCRSVRLGALSP